MRKYISAIFGAIIGLFLVWILHKGYGLFWEDDFKINKFGTGGIRGPEIFMIGYGAYMGYKGKLFDED